MTDHQSDLDTSVRSGIRMLWPECPDALIEQFVEGCHLGSDELIARARFTLTKPYGFNHILQDDGEYGISFAQMNPGQSTSLHYHTMRREFFCVRAGTLTLRKGPGMQTLGRFSCGFSTPFEQHSVSNAGTELLELLEIFSPALLNDKVRVRDAYNRKLGQVTFLE